MEASELQLGMECHEVVYIGRAGDLALFTFWAVSMLVGVCPAHAAPSRRARSTRLYVLL
jgi:hypothetical protein